MGKTGKRAVILFSHGSLLCGAGEALDAHAARLRSRGEYDFVEVGYLNYSAPPFRDAVQSVVDRGADELIVLPYFLVPGYFVRHSLPEAVDRERARHPGVTFRIAEPLGHDARLADTLLDAALGARTAEHWRAPLAHAAHACRPSPECPLYETPECPKSPGTRRMGGEESEGAR